MLRHRRLLPTRYVRAALCVAPLTVMSLTTSLTTSVSAQTPARTTTTQSIALTRFVGSLERAGFSGSVLLADQQQVLLFRTMGLADRSTDRAIATSDRWRYTSVSTQITAALTD